MNFDEWLARNLAAMFLEGPWNETGIVQSLQRFCPPDTRSDQHDLVADLTRQFSGNRHPEPDEITSFLCRHDAFLRATKYFLDEPADVPIALGEPCFTPVLSDKGIAVPSE